MQKMGSWCRGMPRHQLTDHDPIEFPDLALHNPSNRSIEPRHIRLCALVVGHRQSDFTTILRGGIHQVRRKNADYAVSLSGSL
jgi:hypothetical protein